MADPENPLRVFFWVQHLLGTGHLRRALLLAAAIASRGGRVVLASGGPPTGFAPPRGVELLELPPIRSADADFTQLIDARGDPPSPELWAKRRAMLRTAFARFAPHVLVVEHWPFGRRAFTDEVSALLADARTRGAAVVCSVREVLVSKSDPSRFRAMLERARALDRILVHGDPALLPFEASFPFAAELGAKLVHTGYVAPPPGRLASDERSEILVSAGGGAVGAGLCAIALEAARLLVERPWRLITGSMFPPAQLAALTRAAPAHVRIERSRPDLFALIAKAAVSVSQAGYNTVVEALAAGTPMVLVPFETAREDEQLKRARALAVRGLAQLVREKELDPNRLVQAIRAALAAPRPEPASVRLDGAERTTELLAELAGARAG